MQAQKASSAKSTSSLRIRRTTLKDLAVQRIQEAIEKDELKSGQQITEVGLAKSLGVAQATIREALIELEHQGFIEHLGPRNTRITIFTQRHIDDIYKVRKRLECLAIELLAEVDSTALKACRAAQHVMQCAAVKGSTPEFYRADLAFHRELWRATGNACLVESLERFVPKLFAFGIILHPRLGKQKFAEVVEMHGQLLDLVEAGQVDAARALMEQSMEHAWSDDLQSL